MKIRVIGSCCAGCTQLYSLTQQAAEQLNIDPKEVEYSNNIQEIIEMGLITTPVLSIDGKPQQLKAQNIDAIKEVIVQATNKAK
jgi:protein-disulfide isomerase